MTESKKNAPRIAIPVPHSGDREYAERALPQYEEAVRGAGGEPVRIELDQTPVQVMKQIERCDAVLLPGSRADVDPQKYSTDRHEKTAPADAKRDTGGRVAAAGCLQHAQAGAGHLLWIAVVECVPVGIAGAAHRVGDQPQRGTGGGESAHGGDRAGIAAGGDCGHEHDCGREFFASPVRGRSGRWLASGGALPRKTESSKLWKEPSPGHFVLAVQWHPERSVNEGAELAESAKSIFRAFIEAARAKRAELAGEFKSASS